MRNSCFHAETRRRGVEKILRDSAPPRETVFLFIATLLLILSCNQTNIDRAEWQAMPANEKNFYVRTLLGHEKAKEAKGGNDRVFTRAPDDYVKRIDDAYAHGDQRNVDAIFEEMGTHR
ncbi:MAG TPA: hypothetical protein VF713_25430 [Thermoanaerobaculia bacterium]